MSVASPQLLPRLQLHRLWDVCCVRSCSVPWQLEMRDMRVRLLLALMATDDAEGAEAADAAVNETLKDMVRHNYDLYAGHHGVPSVRTLSPALVCPCPWECVGVRFCDLLCSCALLAAVVEMLFGVGTVCCGFARPRCVCVLLDTGTLDFLNANNFFLTATLLVHCSKTLCWPTPARQHRTPWPAPPCTPAC